MQSQRLMLFQIIKVRKKMEGLTLMLTAILEADILDMFHSTCAMNTMTECFIVAIICHLWIIGILKYTSSRIPFKKFVLQHIYGHEKENHCIAWKKSREKRLLRLKSCYLWWCDEYILSTNSLCLQWERHLFIGLAPNLMLDKYCVYCIQTYTRTRINTPNDEIV